MLTKGQLMNAPLIGSFTSRSIKGLFNARSATGFSIQIGSARDISINVKIYPIESICQRFLASSSVFMDALNSNKKSIWPDIYAMITQALFTDGEFQQNSSITLSIHVSRAD